MAAALRQDVSVRLLRIGLLAIFLVGLANGLWWMGHKAERWYPGQDSHDYHLMALNLAHGQGLSREPGPPFVPTLHREPGYPAFVAAVFALANESDDAVAVVQSALVGLSAVLAALLARGVFGDARIALLAGLWTAILPDLGDHARYQMSEALFVPLLLLAALTLFHAWRTRSTRWGVLAGLTFAAAGYVRVMAFPTALLLVLGSLLLASAVCRFEIAECRFLRSARSNLHSAISNLHSHLHSSWAIVCLGVMLLAAAPWVARNALVLGQASFTSRGGGFLMPRGDKAAAPLDKQLEWTGIAAWVAAYPFSELVVPLSHLHREPYVWDGPLGDFELVDTTRAFGRYCQGASSMVAQDSCYTQEGLRMILSHPLQYVLLTPVEFTRLTFYTYPSKLMLFRNWTVWIGLVTLLLCVVSPVWRRPERLWLALLILAYTLPSIAGDAQNRYGVPLVPLYAMFFAAGVVWFMDFLRRSAKPASQEQPRLPAY
ncbi:MAG: glycosyltransferase family 39 protein [Chloroflexi bacterium]|nr:glycosyltransferase family 39 protein [Chloroflexota bacterium]